MKRHRNLNEALQEFLLFGGGGAPHVLPYLVSLKVFAFIEQAHAMLECLYVHCFILAQLSRTPYSQNTDFHSQT